MFGIGSWEFFIVVVLALLLFGPDKLPQFARTLGRFMRDIKKYQDLMQSTIRGEMLAMDPTAETDPFEKGKEFREKVAGGGFSRPAPKAASQPDTADRDAEAPAAADEVETPAPDSEVESPTPADEAPAPEDSSEIGEDAHEGADEIAPASEDGEGERGEA